MVYAHCKIDMNNGVIVENVPVQYVGRGLTEEYGMCVINGILYNVTRNVLTMPPGTFYRGMTWDEELIEHFNVIRPGEF